MSKQVTVDDLQDARRRVMNEFIAADTAAAEATTAEAEAENAARMARHNAMQVRERASLLRAMMQRLLEAKIDPRDGACYTEKANGGHEEVEPALIWPEL